jgi:hypothetical protein
LSAWRKKENENMALMMGKLHAALVSAGVEPNAAREAAEEVASYEHELAEIKATPTQIMPPK